MKNFLIVILIASILIAAGCARKEESKEVVAQINDYYMSVEDFKQDLRALTLYRPQSIKTMEDKMEILNDLIEKEILLQVAQTLNLDKDKKFIKTIENYWKQSLLVLLVQKKAKEISDSIHIYDDEVRAYYEQLKLRNPEIRLLPEIKQDIKRSLRREKETATMQKWLDDLKEKSYIKINEEVLKSMELK